MKNIIIFISFLFKISLLNANSYYVATDGSDSNSGSSLNEPFKSISKATGMAVAGDIIYVRGGIHTYSSTISLTKNGTENAPITLTGYGNERPLIDFSGTAFGKRGFELKGSYWFIKGLDICKAGDNGMIITGNYNTVEFCSFFENKDSGLQLGGGAHDNKIINCDSYWNADPTDYGDADGFACKLDVGTNNYFYGCRAWLNVDDGWDGYMRGNDDVSTILENCWTWQNGYFKDGSDGGTNANGNGFKMGGSDEKSLKHNFTLRNCVAFDNKSKGFDQNNNKGSMILENCSGYRNKGNNYSISGALAVGKTCSVTNCINFDGKISLGGFVIQTTNSWMSPFSVSSNDFVSLDTTGITASRKPDGSLPEVDFFRLKYTSDLIDAGTNVGLAYLGSAPDLGAFEFNPATGVYISQFREMNAYFSDGNLVLNFNENTGGPVCFRLYNINGQLILNSQTYSGNVLNCNSLKPGIYVVEVYAGNERFSKKLFKY
ncbi:MAG: T9SS type A sorting domain-containing protein [Bacteroidetes bacterium]|nr:MAG: T9SS type A sorting domain-containing protein [Bacteroidota bacterium]